MTHATITRHSATRCAVDFAYDERTKNAVKTLAGADFDGQQWTVPTMSLPALKGIFATLTVEPDVIADYHALLARMLDDLATSMGRKGNLGTHIAELLERHQHGLAAIRKNGYKAPERHASVQNYKNSATTPASAATVAQANNGDDAELALWLRGVQNAAKMAERKAQIVKAAQTRRRKKQAEVTEVAV